MERASAVMWTVHRSAVVVEELVKLPVYRQIPALTLTCAHELWVVTESTGSRIQEQIRRFGLSHWLCGRVTVTFGRGSKPAVLNRCLGSRTKDKILKRRQVLRTEGLKSGPTTVYLNSRRS